MSAPAIRMPVSTASRKGVSGLAAAAIDRRVVLTSLGRPVAVVDSAERLDEDVRRLREGARDILDAYATVAADRARRVSLTDLCARLAVSEDAVRARAAQLRGQE